MSVSPSFSPADKPSLFAQAPHYIKAKVLSVTPVQRGLIAAALVLIVCQLVALGLVAREQVSQADRRASQLALEQAAAAQCQANDTIDVSECLLKARKDHAGGMLPRPDIVTTNQSPNR